MQKEMLRTELNLQRLYQELLPTVYRAAYTYLKNRCDSEDAAQEAFLRLAGSRRSFEDERQIKAWLVVTVGNICKDMLRRKYRQDLNLADHPELAAPERDSRAVLDALLDLPEKYKTAIYLYYYEAYTISEIAEILGKNPNTVSSSLQRARKRLKKLIKEANDE